MRLQSISSGSSGNSIYIGSDTTHLLVDVGISGKKIEQGLNLIDLSCRDIDGILITHEHSDHIKGLGVLSRKYGIPIYATEGTIREIRSCSDLGAIDDSLFNVIAKDAKTWIKDIQINPFRISHDAAEPVGYKLSSEGRSVAVVTDLGMYDDYIVNTLQNLDAVFIEANHDVRMLQTGVYPYHLKQRILGNRGHLSNEASGRLLSKILHDDMKYVFLSHLSHENNLPELAFEAVRLEVTMAENKYRGDDFNIMIAKRNEPSECVIV